VERGRQEFTAQPPTQQGLLRLEGKEYVMQEGDVVHFRFNV
jgi:ribosome-binding ATPase YchF (GTP1/OBG family)